MKRITNSMKVRVLRETERANCKVIKLIKEGSLSKLNCSLNLHFYLIGVIIFLSLFSY